MKRFYKSVTAETIDSQWVVLLDGKAVHTPMRRVLSIPCAALTMPITQEWQDQIDVIRPETMPLTQILTTIQDRVIPNRQSMMMQFMDYLSTDLLVYPDLENAVFSPFQKEKWQPFLDALKIETNVTLRQTAALGSVQQDQNLIGWIDQFLHHLDDYQFGLLAIMTHECRSVIMGLLFLCAPYLNEEQYFNAVWVEDLYKSSLYNVALYGQAPDTEKTHHSFRQTLKACFQIRDTLGNLPSKSVNQA